MSTSFSGGGNTHVAMLFQDEGDGVVSLRLYVNGRELASANKGWGGSGLPFLRNMARQYRLV